MTWHIFRTVPDLRIHDVYEVSVGVRSTGNKDGGIVLDIRDGQMFQLNATGALIFSLLQQQKTESQIIDEITQQFCISREVAETDFNEFIGSLEQQDLVCDKNRGTFP